uniref:gamma-glutamyltransferase n=1 Tax=Stieleria sp. TaxID=2795976 RepID=UPI003567BDFC
MQRVCQFGLLIVIVGFAVEGSPALGQSRRDAESRDGMVVAVSPDAAEVGAEILEQGGTAVDSAIATAFALAVTHPSAG